MKKSSGKNKRRTSINLGKIKKLPRILHFLIEKGKRQVGKR